MTLEVNLCETTLLLTRPEAAAKRFEAMVKSHLGVFGSVIITPLLKISFLAIDALPTEGETLVFSSENGVAALAAVQPGAGRPAWCVGNRTAEEAERAGFRVAGIGATAESLTAMLIAEIPRRPLVHVAGKHRRGDLAARLGEAGLRCRTVEAYDQVAQPLNAAAQGLLEADADIVAPIFSPRSAALLFDAASLRKARIHVAAISSAAAENWRPRPGERIELAAHPDADGVLAAMGRLFDADRSA